MSFKLGRFFTLASSFIMGSFFFILGAFSIILPWSPYLQKVTTQFILENTLILSLFGLGFTLIGISIVIYTLLKTRHRYVQIRTGDLGIILDENVIHQYLEAYWQKHFPSAQVPFELCFKKHSLQIIADLPYLPFMEQKAFLEQVRQDFSDLFGRVLGYPYDVQLIASFQSNPPTSMQQLQQDSNT
jgi:hypothetical protein